MKKSWLLDFGAYLEDTPLSVMSTETVQVGLHLQNPCSDIDTNVNVQWWLFYLMQQILRKQNQVQEN